MLVRSIERIKPDGLSSLLIMLCEGAVIEINSSNAESQDCCCLHTANVRPCLPAVVEHSEIELDSPIQLSHQV